MLKELIYNYFDSERQKKESKETEFQTHLAPSYLTSCTRQLVYKKRNTPASNPIDTHSYIKFAMGDCVHEKFREILKKAGIQIIESEVMREKEWLGVNWKYAVDAIALHGDRKFVFEFKSTYFSGFNAVEQEAKEEHIIQLYCYMELEQIENGILLYLGRDNGLLIEYAYTIQGLRERFQNKIDMLATVKHAILCNAKNNKNHEAIREFKIVLKNTKGEITESFQKDNIKYKSDWQCGYCQYKNLCWEKELSEIKNHKFYIDGVFHD